MTKISFDVDFSKDPETLLKEIQDKAKTEVDRRESKERAKAYLSSLHETVNEQIGTSYKNVADLIRALADHASPVIRERLSGVASTGRRKTVSMTKDLYKEIKSKLSQSSPNKAAIARETGASIVQVRKVASGGFEEKFGEGSDSVPPQTGTIEQDVDVPITPWEVDAVDDGLPAPEALPNPESAAEELPLPEPLPVPETAEESVESQVEPSDALPVPEFIAEDQESIEASGFGSDAPPLPPPVPEPSEELGAADSLPPIPAPPMSTEEELPFDSGEQPLPDPTPQGSPDETAPPRPPVPPPPAAIDDDESGVPAPPQPSAPFPPAPDATFPGDDASSEASVGDSGDDKPSLKLGGGKKKPSLKLGGAKGKFSARITRPPLPPGAPPPDS